MFRESYYEPEPWIPPYIDPYPYTSPPPNSTWSFKWWYTCPKCNKLIEYGDVYCKHCGEQLIKKKTCPHCGKEIE